MIIRDICHNKLVFLRDESHEAQKVSRRGYIMNPAFIDSYNNPSGFTNNWLESRKPEHFFDQRYPDFPLYQENNIDPRGYATILKGTIERSELSDTFFGEKNIKVLKEALAKTIERSAGFKISPESQSTHELILVMRSIYLREARHLPENIMGQVRELNSAILKEIVPRVLDKIQLTLSYRRDRSQQPLPMDRPLYMSSAGTRSNPGRIMRGF